MRVDPRASGAGPRSLEIDLKIELASKSPFSLDVRLSAPPGITVLFGPSGSGKSTTLAAIAGLIRPQSGRIRLGDEVWFDSASGIDRPIEERKVAFVFQTLALFPHLTAIRNVAYGVDRRLDRKERKARAMAMLERMRVPHLAHRHPPTFSGGEAQRVALARAFAMSPRLMLLDEAFSAMDRELRRELAADVRRYIEDTEIPVILVTHHRNEARAMGDRAVLIAAGRITHSGSLDTLIPELRAPRAIGGEPASRRELFEDIGNTPHPELEENASPGPRSNGGQK